MGDYNRAKDPECLQGMREIIRFTNIPERTFYGKGFARELKASRYVFRRRGKNGRPIYWTYKRLIIAWLTEKFSDHPENTPQQVQAVLEEGEPGQPEESSAG